MQDIKDEVKRSCPKVITDGSRPFRAHWREYNHDHITVVVNFHFDIPPRTQEYLDNQEQVLLAIARAVKKNNVKFALPYRVSVTAEDN
jgi:small-conductance mechanosensitive channel